MLSKIFPEAWSGRKNLMAFFLGWIYALIGIVLARIIFPRDPAIAAVAFTSILIIPSIELTIAHKLNKERFRNLSIIQLIKDNRGSTTTYIALFLGMLLVYSTMSIVLSSFQVNDLFRSQLDIRNTQGGAGFLDLSSTNELFFSIFLNNMVVILITFIVSIFIGSGGIFLITWNASVWGTIFGVTARNAALSAPGFSIAHAIFFFALIIIIVMPHMLLEIAGYIEAMIAGSTISEVVVKKNTETYAVFSNVVVRSVLLLLVGIIAIAIGAFVETLVLQNVTLYQDIIVKSMSVKTVI